MFVVKTTVTKKRVEALLECWGSRYSAWAGSIQSHVAPKKNARGTSFLARHSLNGGSVVIQDDEGKQHVLDKVAIEKGLNLMPKVSPHQWSAFLQKQEDAETADQFMQLALFGELKYG